jgi:Ca2+-binding EF-hand superfamily protein
MIDDNRREEILGVFRSFSRTNERNDDNFLLVSDAKKALKQLGLEGLKAHEIKTYFHDERLEGLNSDLFLRFAAAKTIQWNLAQRAFELVDEAHKGFVVLEDIAKTAADLGENFTENELTEMIQFLDDDGIVTAQHFFKIARKVNL